MPKRTIVDRFWPKVNIVNDADSCWIWIGNKDSKGYGRFRFDTGSKVFAHRLSYLLENGAFDSSLHILHRCDTPLCVRPSHLFLGTHQDNMEDMRVKGRARTGNGTDAPCRKLNNRVVVVIRMLHSMGYRTATIASLFSLSLTTVQNINNGKLWSGASSTTSTSGYSPLP